MAFRDSPSPLVDTCIEFICNSFSCFVQQVSSNSETKDVTPCFGSSCSLPAKVVEQMLTRLNRLHRINDYGLLLIRHATVSGALKRIRLPGSFARSKAILSEIGNFHYLTEVNLAFCRKLPTNCRVLESLLLSAQHLLSLKLNFLEGDLAFEFLPQFTAMKDLDLTATLLTTDQLAKAVNTMHCLESLDVSSTMVTLLGGLRAVSSDSLSNLRFLGLHDLAVSNSERNVSVSGVQSELVQTLRSLRKVTHLDVSNPRFSSDSLMSPEFLLNAVLTAPPAVTDIDVSNIASDKILLKELQKSPLLSQLTYVGCITMENIASSLVSTYINKVAPHVHIGSLFCSPEHVGHVFRSEYLKHPLLLRRLFHKNVVQYLGHIIKTDAIWSRFGDFALSALWLYCNDAKTFVYAVYPACYFLHNCSALPQFFLITKRYLEFVANCFRRMVGAEQTCLHLLDCSIKAVRKHASFSVCVATCLVNALENFNKKPMSCTELCLLQCLYKVIVWNKATVRSHIGFDIGAVELLIARLEHWSQTTIVERQNSYTEIAVVVSKILSQLTEGTSTCGSHMLKLLSQVNCIQSLLLSLDAFSYNETIVWDILCVLGNAAEDMESQSALFQQSIVVETGMKYMSKSNNDSVALAACHLMAVLLEADEHEWTSSLETRDTACHSLIETLLGLEIHPQQPPNIGYSSIKPLLDMLECPHVVEVRCFGMWMLANMCSGSNRSHYYTCLKENNHSGLEIVCRLDLPSGMPRVFFDAKEDVIAGFQLWFEGQRQQ